MANSSTSWNRDYRYHALHTVDLANQIDGTIVCLDLILTILDPRRHALLSKKYAPGEVRTLDLQIMRLTLFRLSY